MTDMWYQYSRFWQIIQIVLKVNIYSSTYITSRNYKHANWRKMAIAKWKTDNLTVWVNTMAHNTGTLGAPLGNKGGQKTLCAYRVVRPSGTHPNYAKTLLNIHGPRYSWVPTNPRLATVVKLTPPVFMSGSQVPRCKACRTDCPLAAKHVGQYNKWLDVLRIYVSASQISRTSAEKDRFDRIIHNILLRQQDEISYKQIL